MWNNRLPERHTACEKITFDFIQNISILHPTNAVQIIRQKLPEQSGSFFIAKFDFFSDFPILGIMNQVATIITKKITSPLG